MQTINALENDRGQSGHLPNFLSMPYNNKILIIVFCLEYDESAMLFFIYLQPFLHVYSYNEQCS